MRWEEQMNVTEVLTEEDLKEIGLDEAELDRIQEIVQDPELCDPLLALLPRRGGGAI
jgi:hypothetical protein